MLQCKIEIFSFLKPLFTRTLIAEQISSKLLIPVDIITFLFNLPILLSKGIFVISPDAIFTYSGFNFFTICKLSSSKGLVINFIFFLLHLNFIFLKSSSVSEYFLNIFSWSKNEVFVF